MGRQFHRSFAAVAASWAPPVLTFVVRRVGHYYEYTQGWELDVETGLPLVGSSVGSHSRCSAGSDDRPGSLCWRSLMRDRHYDGLHDEGAADGSWYSAVRNGVVEVVGQDPVGQRAFAQELALTSSFVDADVNLGFAVTGHLAERLGKHREKLRNRSQARRLREASERGLGRVHGVDIHLGPKTCRLRRLRGPDAASPAQPGAQRDMGAFQTRHFWALLRFGWVEIGERRPCGRRGSLPTRRPSAPAPTEPTTTLSERVAAI